MNNALMFSKASDEWSTPQPLFEALHAEFGFELDVAATAENTKCAAYFTQADNALVQVWGARTCWMNPPYSQSRAFMAKAVEAASNGATVVVLVPARTDTRAFHQHVWDDSVHQPRPGVELRFLRGRVKFGGMTSGAPFPSMVVVFRPHVQPFELV